MQRPRILPYAEKRPINVVKFAKLGKIERRHVILNDKQKEKMITKIERIVRSSPDYKEYIRFLKENIDMTKCAFFNNVTNKYSKKIKIEIHHEPFNLFQITETVLNKWITEDWDLNPLLIAEEVMEIHFKNQVGLYPLSATCHELVHSGALFIPVTAVFGGFASFIQDYEEYLSRDTIETIQHKINLSKEFMFDTKVLTTKFTYLDIDGWNLPSPLTPEQVKEMKDEVYQQKIASSTKTEKVIKVEQHSEEERERFAVDGYK